MTDVWAVVVVVIVVVVIVVVVVTGRRFGPWKNQYYFVVA
jgi:hypothetical protein